MRESRLFLVIAADAERLALISNTLHRKFPNSAILTCRDSEPALAIARTQPLDAIVANAGGDLEDLAIVRSLRAETEAPIVFMSSQLSETPALAAGASRFLNTQRWLLVGTLVAELVHARGYRRE